MPLLALHDYHFHGFDISCKGSTLGWPVHWQNNNWASQLNPIGSIGLVLIDNHRMNCAVARDAAVTSI
jgi:hypothetical protein